MGLRDMLRAIREYPAVSANLESARFELQQARQELTRSEQDRQSLRRSLEEKTRYSNFLAQKSAALQAALAEYCPQVSFTEEMKRLYNVLAPDLDSRGFTLYHVAERLTGINISSVFPYEDNRGLFEEMDGRQLLRYLIAAHFHAVDWTVVPGTTYESAALREVVTSTPEYRSFERQLYEAVLDRMGFHDLITPQRKKVVEFVTDKKTELKFYCPLSGELAGRELDGRGLLAFQNVVLRRIEDEHLYLDAKRGLMADFDGLDCVNDKVYSMFPSVEEVGGELYGVAVCQIKRDLGPGELEQLKEFCAGQFSYGWGENLREFPCQTDQGKLHISFWQDSGASILTKEEMETVRAASRSSHQVKRGGGAR